eukprot:SAG31_NODE_1288_length_8994_cov_4.105003_6_plen_251_part_00
MDIFKKTTMLLEWEAITLPSAPIPHGEPYAGRRLDVCPEPTRVYQWLAKVMGLPAVTSSETARVGLMKIANHDGSGVGRWLDPYVEWLGKAGSTVQFITMNAANDQAPAAILPGAAFIPTVMAELLQHISPTIGRLLTSVDVPQLLTMLATPIDRRQQSWACGLGAPPVQPDTPTCVTIAVRTWTLMRALLEPELRGVEWIMRLRPAGVVAFDLNDGLDVPIYYNVRQSTIYDKELVRLRKVRTNVSQLL